MKLLVDIGNSRVKWALGTTGPFVAQGELSIDAGAGWRPLLDSGHVPDEIRIANVAGAAAGARIAKTLEGKFGTAPIFARSAATGAGVRSGYTDSGQLGVDRWLAICAAFDRYRAPICVVDAGTATTIDLVTGSGEHQGGLILPGLRLMQSALLGGTGDLAHLAAATAVRGSGDVPASVAPDPTADLIALGRDTAMAIRYGALQATAGLVRTCMDRLVAHSSGATTPPLLLVTGGAATALQAELLRMDAFRLEHRPQLVLEGLALEPPCFTVAN